MGLYTNYLFAFILLGQGLYTLWRVTLPSIGDRFKLSHRFNKEMVGFGLISLVTILAFAPWFIRAGLEEVGTVVGNYPLDVNHIMTSTAASFGLSTATLAVIDTVSFVGLIYNRQVLLSIGLALIPLLGVLGIDHFSGYFYHPKQLLLTLPFLFTSFSIGSINLIQTVSGFLGKTISPLFSRSIVLPGAVSVVCVILASSLFTDMRIYYTTVQTRDWRGLVTPPRIVGFVKR